MKKMVALLRWKSSTCAKLASDQPPNLIKKEDAQAKRFTAILNSELVSALENSHLSALTPEMRPADSPQELLETLVLLAVMRMLSIILVDLAMNKSVILMNSFIFHNKQLNKENFIFKILDLNQ